MCVCDKIPFFWFSIQQNPGSFQSGCCSASSFLIFTDEQDSSAEFFFINFYEISVG